MSSLMIAYSISSDLALIKNRIFDPYPIQLKKCRNIRGYLAMWLVVMWARIFFPIMHCTLLYFLNTAWQCTVESLGLHAAKLVYLLAFVR